MEGGRTNYFYGPGYKAALLGGVGCADAPQGWINDDSAGACWAVHASPVIIENNWMSVHAGFSFVNMLYRSYGEQPPVATLLGLEGVVVGNVSMEV